MSETITLVLDTYAAMALSDLLFARLHVLTDMPESLERDAEMRALQSIAIQAAPQAAEHAERPSWAKKVD